MLDETEKALLAGSAFSEMSKAGCSDTSETKPPRQNAQIKFQGDQAEAAFAAASALAEAEAAFAADIALVLIASGWRATAYLLAHAANCIEAGDFLGAERNRRRARDQFVEANDAFKQFQEARAGTAAWIGADAFLRPSP